jgi:hypothetical protein
MERLWQWESTDRRECERCGRQRTVYHYLRKSDRRVPVISIRLGARLSNKPTLVIFHILLCSPVLSIRHFFHPQVTSTNFPSITSPDCHFLSIIITPYLRPSFATLLWLAMCIRTDFNSRLWCGSGRVGVLFHIYFYFRNRERTPFREINTIQCGLEDSPWSSGACFVHRPLRPDPPPFCRLLSTMADIRFSGDDCGENSR